MRAVVIKGFGAEPELVDVPTPGPGTLLRPGGVLVSTNGAADPESLAPQGRRGINLYNSASRQDLEVIAGLAADGRILVRIDAEVPLSEAADAVARARAAHATGKTVIVP